MKKWLIVGAALLLFVAGCGKKEEEKAAPGESGLKKVSIVLDWTPNTNHTGLYVAREKGFFKEHGIDADIILPGEAGVDQLVASGKADFGITTQESVTEARTQDVPIVSIGAIIQHNTSGFASPAGKNITRPKDFEGKTYGGWGAPVEQAMLKTIMEQDGGNPEKLEMINMGDTDFFTAVKRDIDFAWIYQAWTGVEAELRGEDINMLYLIDYADELDYYTPVIGTNEKLIEKDPELVKAFMAAVSEGYGFAIEKPDEAAQILIDAEPDLDPDLVKNSQKWLADKYKEDAPRWGEQKKEVWERYAGWMMENKLLDKELDVDSAFTNEFLPE